MGATITNIKRTGSVTGMYGKVKIEGVVSLDPATPKVVNFNFTFYVNTALPSEDDSFAFAGSANNDGSLNINVLPAFSGMAEELMLMVFVFIAEIEHGDTPPETISITTQK